MEISPARLTKAECWDPLAFSPEQSSAPAAQAAAK